MHLKYVFALTFLLVWCSTSYFEAPPTVIDALMLFHFAKRMAEVQFVHDFSGSPTEEALACLVIGFYYTMI